MKTIQKVKVQVQKGKITKKEEVGSPRPVVDTVAEQLVQQGEIAISAKEIAKIKGIKSFEIWTEAELFDVNTAKKDDLTAYATANNIDLGDATKVDDIRKVVKDAIEVKN